MIIWLVDEKSISGARETSMHAASHRNVQVAYLRVGDQIVPENGPTDFMDFDSSNYAVGYKRLCDAIGGDGGLAGISYNSYAQCDAYHAFNMCATSPRHMQLIECVTFTL